MRTILYLIIAFFISPIPTSAGFFGPSNYDECVLENMKGVTSDQAARAIQYACREKFPSQAKEKIVKNKNEFPGFPFNEDIYAHRLLNWYIRNYDDIKYQYSKPEDLAFEVYETKRKENPDLRYEAWANESNIKLFFERAQEFIEYMNGE